MTVVACRADPARPARGASARRRSGARSASSGVRVLDLRPEVRTQLVGPTTCTHLNDVLRGLEDVDWLSRDAHPWVMVAPAAS